MNYLKKGLELIKHINNLGYEAYIVGGAVRDDLLKIDTYDVDITTSMPLEEISKHFKIIDNGSKYLSITIIYDNYNFEITHFRKDISYDDNRHPSVELTNNLLEDLERRDFTINALLYDINGNVIDKYNGLDDLKNKLIKCIGSPDKRFDEDALRILRALYLSSKLGFNIENNTLNSMINKKKNLANLSFDRIYEAFIKIINGKYNNGINYINKYDLFEYIKPFKNWIKIINNIKDEPSLSFIYYYNYHEFSPCITKNIKKIILDGIKIVESNYSYLSLYKYQESFKLLKEAFLNIIDNYDELLNIINNFKIKNDNELKMSKLEISSYYDKDKRSIMIDKIIDKILHNEINNDYDEILNFIKRNK